MDVTIPDYATRFDTLSLSVCLLSLEGVGSTPRQATGFFWRRSNQVFLFTNWHVVTGINPLDGKSSSGWCPENLVVDCFSKISPGGPELKNSLAIQFRVQLYEEFHKPFWVEHRMRIEWGVDLVALDITSKLQNEVFCVNDYNFAKLFHFVGSDMFVVGHPRPKADSRYPVSFPIWKRGSIASELMVPFDMRPAFLIDSRTSRGMSGSPAVARVFGPAVLADGTTKYDSVIISEFMGVYSGRLHDDENNASLGLVWHRNLIDQLLADPKAASREWVPSKSSERFNVLQ